MNEDPILPLSRFLGTRFSLSDASPERALADDEAEFMLEILEGVDWSEPMCRFGDYEIRHHDGWTEGGNVGLFHGSRLMGFYEMLNLWIHPDHRGRGLAIPLILAVAKLRGGGVLPDFVETQGYSPAGLLAHSAAHIRALLCAIRKRQPIPEEVLREYNIRDPEELVRMFGEEAMESLYCCGQGEEDR